MAWMVHAVLGILHHFNATLHRLEERYHAGLLFEEDDFVILFLRNDIFYNFICFIERNQTLQKQKTFFH